MTKKKKASSVLNSAKTTMIPAIAVIMGVVVLIMVVSVKKSFNLTQPTSPKDYTHDGQWQRITDKKALFKTKIFLKRDRTFVSIPIKFDDRTQAAWLTIQSKAQAGIPSYLITHPILETLNWPEIHDGPFHLYQRESVYKTFSDFLKNPPSESELLIDQYTKAQPQFRTLKHTVLSDNSDLTQVKFILTTYLKPRIADGITFYENVIDATNGSIDKNSNLTWELTVPTAATSSPFYLGKIHIDYQR